MTSPTFQPGLSETAATSQAGLTSGLGKMLAAVAAGVAPMVWTAWKEPPPEDAMPLAELVRGLEEKRYTPITEISFDDGVWEVEAYKDDRGRELDVDPTSGEVLREHDDDGDRKPPADAMALSELIRKVEDQGYNNLDDISFEGRSWEMEAVRDGKQRELKVDPASGKVTSDRPDDDD